MLPRHQRLHTAAEFRMVRQKGRKWESPSFLAFIVPSRSEQAPRLGVIVSAKIGSSVRRKRASRVLRAGFAESRDALGQTDMVLIARPYALRKTSRDVAGELRRMAGFLRR